MHSKYFVEASSLRTIKKMVNNMSGSYDANKDFYATGSAN